MLKFAIVGDLHIAETPPGRRAEGYQEQIERKLRECLDRARDYGCTLVVLIGDIFHKKRANANSHRLVQRVANILASYPELTIWILPGNHDLADGTLESIARQPIGILGMLPNVELVWGSKTFEGETFRLVPGTSEVCDATDLGLSWFMGTEQIVLAHAPISERQLPWPTWAVHELGLHDDVALLAYGHQHDQARYVGNHGRCAVVATGAIARGALSEANHHPAVILVDMEAAEGRLNTHVQVVPLANVEPIEYIFRWAEHAEEKTDAAALANFVANLGEAQLAGFSREGLAASIRQRPDVPVAVKTVAVDILESV